MVRYSIFSHPNQVCMSYYKHMSFALDISKDLAIGSVQSFIHAFFPNLFITSTTDLNKKLTEKLNNSGCRNPN